MEVYTKIFNLFFDVEGRANRTEFCMFYIGVLSIGCLLALLDVVLGWGSPEKDYGVLVRIFLVVAFVLLLIVTVRRLHDINFSSWWALVLFVPFVSFLMLLFLLVWPPTKGANSYGYGESR